MVCKIDFYNISEFRSAYSSIGQLKCRTPPFHLFLCDVFDAVGSRSGVLGCTPPFRNRNRKFGTPNCKNQFFEKSVFGKSVFEIAILKNASLRFRLENGIWNFVVPLICLLISRIVLTCMLPPFLLEHTPLDL